MNQLTADQEQCVYCKQYYPKPVSLHHEQAECDFNIAADLIREECAKICESTLVRSRAKYTEEVIRAISVCAATIRATITDPEAVRRTVEDVERYRWLRANHNGRINLLLDGVDTPEAAIDTARSAK